ncbi:MAG: tRNA epoxyqueuosine(34) reductase QueG [Rhizobiales bacterium]|nr:tRNA epoxyqueuosine(34) reductase QueG [Hyphomicrobiales bacterium]
MSSHSSIEQRLEKRALAAGFDVMSIAGAELAPEIGEQLEAFVAADRHGTMDWLADTRARRKQPTAMWPGARSAVVLGMNYGPTIDPIARLEQRSSGVISVYALNRDYHDVVKGKLKALAQWLANVSGGDVKVFVDTAPLMEKPLAQAAGIGWLGKHTNLVSRQFGSWLFLGVILTSAELAAGNGEDDHCGACRACLDVCPTKAFPNPYEIDARRCISYLTIEYKGHIAQEFRGAMGNRIYGCDDCLAVCPWNKFARDAAETKLTARDDLMAPDLAMLAGLDDAAFRKLFAGSPVKRTGRDRFVRNVLIAIGNSADRTMIPVVERLLCDPSGLVRAMAVWALGQLGDTATIEALRQEHAGDETDRDVLGEWQEAGR